MKRINKCLFEKLRHRRTIKNFLFVDSVASTNKKTFLLIVISKKVRKLIYVYIHILTTIYRIYHVIAVSLSENYIFTFRG